MELFNEDKIPKRTLGEVVILDNTITSPSIVNGSFLGGSITIGSGENVFRVDRNGIYLGSSSFATAPFRVDMQGNLVASSARIAGDIVSDNYVEGVSGYKLEYETGNAYLGNAIISGSSIIGDNNVLARTIGSSINQSGQFIKDVVNTNLSTATKQILSDFTFGTSGALQIGTYENGVSGDIRISPNGILGRNKNGDTTFSINGTTGDATFGGTLVAASGTFGTVTAGILSGVEISGSAITGGTITGATIQTATSGQRIILDGSDNKLKFMNGANLYGQIYPMAGGSNVGFYIESHGAYAISPASIGLYEPVSGITSIVIDAINIELNGNISSITLNGVTRTSWPASFSGNLSDLYINTTKSWGSYGITGLGTITPYSNNSYSLGSSSYKWNNVYSTYGTFDYLGKSLNANSYGITGLGTITPYSNNSYSLGSSSYYWRNIYGISIIPHVSTASYLGNSSYYWDYLYIDTIRGASGTSSIGIENDAYTKHLFPDSTAVYDLGSSFYFYRNTFTQSLRLRTGQSTNPSYSGEIRYYDATGGGFRGVVGSWLGQFDMTAK